MSYKYIPNEYDPYFDLIIDCIKIKGEDIQEVINRITEDTKLMEECLDDKFLGFKLHAKKVRDEYEKAVDEAIEKTQIVWDRCEDKVSQSRPILDKTNKEVEKLLNEVNLINQSLEDVSFYKIERLMELVEKFNQMSESDKAVLAKLVNMD